MSNLKIGAVGAGRATRELTLPAFKFAKEGVLVAVCDPAFENAQKLAQENNLRAYASLEEMVRQEKIDVAIINTPVDTHAELAVKAMKLGCHVIIEKPAVSKTQDLQTIQEVSKETGKKVTVVHNYKYFEGPQKAYKMYTDGLLGDIIHVERVWMSPPKDDRMERDPSGWWHKMVGGRLADALPHMLYLPYMFVGPMELLSVSARKTSADRPWSFCDDTNITLQTPKAYVNIRESVSPITRSGCDFTYYTILYGTKRNVFCTHHRADIINPSRKDDVRRLVESTKEYVRAKLHMSPKVSRSAHNVFYDMFFLHVMGLGENPTTWEEAINVSTLEEQIGLKIHECVTQKKKIVFV